MNLSLRPTSPLAAGSRTLLALAALTAVALAACTTGATPAPAANLPLEGTRWQLASYVGPEGTEVPVPAGVAATARLESGTVSGNGGCNDYSGSYTLDGDKLTFGAIASTQMACAGPADTLETAYFAALGKVGSYAIEDVTLLLKNADGEPILTFEQGTEASLTGTSWLATGINNGSGGVVSLVAGSEVTAVFGDDGTVTGSGGCNSYSGPYTVEGTAIEIGPLGSTMKLCNEPAGVDQQEAQFFAALDAATTYAINGTVLELRDDSGALQVSFSTK